MIYDLFGNFLKTIDEKSLILEKPNSIKNSKKKKKEMKWIPKTLYTKKFLLECFFKKSFPSKNIAVVGHLHHGKSSLINCLASSVHLINDKILFKDFSDFFFLEKQKDHTIYLSITTLLLCNNYGKSILFTFLDTPGHPDFFEHTVHAINVSDGIILVVDAAEGILMGTEIVFRQSILEGSKAIIVINALDRLISEFCLNPIQVYKKIIKILDEINSVLGDSFCEKTKFQEFFFFNPIKNNVIFSSFLQRWSFSLEQYSEIYLSSQPSICLSKKDLTTKLWTNFFSRKNFVSENINSMFVEFVLHPLFNLTFLVIGETIINVRKFFQNELGVIGIDFSGLRSNKIDLISHCLTLFLGGCREVKMIPNHTGLTSSLEQHIPASIKNKKFFFNCPKKNFFFGYIGKMLPSIKQKKFLAVTKIISGSLKKNSLICLMTEGHSMYFSENFFLPSKIKGIYLPIGRYNLKISKAPRSSIILIEGIDKKIRKSCIITDIKNKIFFGEESYFSFCRKLFFSNIFSVLNLILEPDQTENLGFLFFSLRKVMKLYSSLNCNILSSGEFLISGPGYLYLDCVINDIKNVFGEEDLKISQILINSKETIKKSLAPNRSFVLKNLTFSIEKNKDNFSGTSFIPDTKIFETFLKDNIISWHQNKTALRAGYISDKIFMKNSLNRKKSNLIWFLGPKADSFGNCKLKMAEKYFFASKDQKETMKLGFDIAVSRGPFSLKPLNQIDFQISLAEILTPKYEKILSFPGKIRRFFHWTFLKNKPVAQYPVCFHEALSPVSFFPVILNLLKANHGKILSFKKIPNQYFTIIRSLIPLKYLMGFEKDLNKINQEKIFSFTSFDNWGEE